MAGLTKEQRIEKEKEKEQAMREAIAKELEEKYKKELESVKSNSKEEIKVTTVSKLKVAVPRPKKIPLDLEVPVISNYNGKLTFISKRSNGYAVEWAEYGIVEYLELAELLSMRNTDRRFYEDNWIVLDDVDEYSAEDLYAFLKVDKYYQNIYTPDNIESFFDNTPEEMIRIVATLSHGMKDCIAAKAQEMIETGRLDSNKKIDTLANILKVEFTKN